MKRSILFLITLVLFSCNKEDETILFKAGYEENMEVNLIQESLNGNLPDGMDYVTNFLKVDLDADGGFDLRFTCTTDSIYDPEPVLYKHLKVEILNDLFELVSVPGSGLAYEKIWEENDYYGTFARKTYFHQFSCTHEIGFVENSTNSLLAQNTVRYFNKGEAIILDNLSWSSDNSFLNMTTTPYEYLYYDFNLGGDSLIGPHYIYPNFCHSPVFGIPLYLIFRKNFGSNVDYGWIRIEITNTNDLYIHSIGTLID